MHRNSRPGRRALIATVVSSLVMTASMGVPAIAVQPQADAPVPWTWEPVPVPPVEVTDPVIPIFAAVGKDMPVAGAKVEIK